MTKKLFLVLAVFAATCAVPAAASAVTFTQTPPAVSTSSSATFEFNHPGAIFFNCTLDSVGVSCNSPHTVTGLADGQHEFSVVGTTMFPGPPICTPDCMPGPPMMLPTAPAIYTWTVNTAPPPDTAPPTLQLINGPKAFSSSKSTNVNFIFTSEAGASFTCTLDGKPFTPCSSPLKLKKLKVGVHELVITVKDQAGNVGTPYESVFAVNSKTTTFKFTGGGTKVKRCVKKKKGGKKCRTMRVA